MALFEKLSGAFQKVFRDLRGLGKLSEKNVQDALREVRLALLDADVNFTVVKEFIARVREKGDGRGGGGERLAWSAVCEACPR
ncbi:MAG: signal recognition particle receptor subunit alpha [Kiritimatiellae bacterium]|nr:signal recognition particle receptor subunit alpha [Kiritimatiellia bacterium]